MPTANPSNLLWVIQQIRKINPKRVLDVGIGFGKWGFLCRDYLESTHLRVRPEDWNIIIDGVEPCKEYISILQETIYTKIHNMTIEEYLPKASGYDLVLANDIIEHLEKKEAWYVLNTLIKQNTWVIATIPLDDQLDINKDIDDKYPYEKHRSIWIQDDFNNHIYLKKYKLLNNKIVLLFHNFKGSA